MSVNHVVGYGVQFYIEWSNLAYNLWQTREEIVNVNRARFVESYSLFLFHFVEEEFVGDQAVSVERFEYNPVIKFSMIFSSLTAFVLIYAGTYNRSRC